MVLILRTMIMKRRRRAMEKRRETRRVKNYSMATMMIRVSKRAMIMNPNALNGLDLTVWRAISIEIWMISVILITVFWFNLDVMDTF